MEVLRKGLEEGRVDLAGKARTGCVPYLVAVLEGMSGVEFKTVSAIPSSPGRARGVSCVLAATLG